MTLAELLEFLDENTDYGVVDGDIAETLRKAQDGSHKTPVMGEIIAAISEGTGCTAPDCVIERAQTVNSLGQLRLKYMKDDAPVEGFRMVEGIIHNIDLAFDEEALRQKFD